MDCKLTHIIMKKYIVFSFTAVLLSLFTLKAQQKAPTISFEKEIHDFGTFLERDGNVSYQFTFTNTGSQPLVINKVRSSCGCTSPSWTKKPVMPAKKGFVKATFDPTNRPGPFNKSITIYSNAENSPIVLRIKGKVKPKKKSIAERYPFKTGDIRMKTNHLGMAKVYHNETKTSDFEFVNVGDKPIEISFNRVPDHITIKAVSQKLAPKEKGKINITFNPQKINDWGFVYDRINMMQNGQSVNKNRLTISASITENFTKLTDEEKANAPVIDFEKTRYNFGKAKQKTKVKHDFTFTNKGKSELKIRKIKASCGGTTVNPSKDIIAPGESATIKAIFNTGSRKGRQTKTITVISNDPENSQIRLWLKGEVIQ